MTPNEKPASPTQGELAVKALRNLIDMRIPQNTAEAGLQVMVTLGPALTEARAALSALDRTTLPPTEEGIGLICECASDGCGKQATVRFERGGVGSYYCHDCYMRIQAIPAGRLALTSGREE